MEINGKQVPVDFKTNWLYKFYNELSGKDILVDGLVGIGTVQTFDVAAHLYYAGHKAWAKKNNQQEVVTYDELYNHVMDMDHHGAIALITEYTDTLKKGVPGEQEAQADAP